MVQKHAESDVDLP